MKNITEYILENVSDNKEDDEIVYDVIKEYLYDESNFSDYEKELADIFHYITDHKVMDKIIRTVLTKEPYNFKRSDFEYDGILYSFAMDAIDAVSEECLAHKTDFFERIISNFEEVTKKFFGENEFTAEQAAEIKKKADVEQLDKKYVNHFISVLSKKPYSINRKYFEQPHTYSLLMNAIKRGVENIK